MSKVPLVVISNDWHIKEENTNIVFDLVEQQCKLAVKLKVKYLFVLGDIFNSRKSQTLLVLNTFGKILDMIGDYKLKLVAIPGNHDKTSYDSNESFLDQFKHHPVLTLISIQGSVPFKEYGLNVYFLPFWSDSVWSSEYSGFVGDYLGQARGEKMEGINILCSHIAVQGSTNNDGTKVQSEISHKMFKYFDKVFLGHYHNAQKIGTNIYHLPSIQQNNFGENSDKGFTVLYSDGSHETIKSNFREYIKVKIDLNELSKEDILRLKEEYSKVTEESTVRFIFEGTEDKLKSINKEEFYALGIDVKTENKDIEIIEDFDTVEITKYTNENIVEEFQLFCEEYKKSFETGVKYLK